MSRPGSTFRSLAGRTRNRVLIACGVVAAGTVLVAAPVIGESLNEGPQRPTGPASAGVMKTVPATTAQAARSTMPAVPGGATVSAKKKKVRKPWQRRLTFSPRITTNALTTEENRGTFVGIRCPAGMKAVSGGVLSGYINLLVSSSSPNHPQTGRYTPSTWWVAVTNTNIDGVGGTLSWRGVVNCMGPVKLGS